MEPADSFNSVTAASRNCLISPWAPASRSTPSEVDRTLPRTFRAAATRRLASRISTVLASHTVQVTTEATTSPISTACTTGSALMYMPQGLRSRGKVAVATTLSCASAAAGTSIHAIAAMLDPHGPRNARARRL